MTNRDDELMGAALVEARKSLDVDEFPVGAVVVLADEVVVRAHWKGAAQLRLLDHAEMLALMEAERSGSVVRGGEVGRLCRVGSSRAATHRCRARTPANGVVRGVRVGFARWERAASG